tara:strand:+ start:10159 stop:10401 length:243 start_codon:yes stop_codon:yes gene_type:complete
MKVVKINWIDAQSIGDCNWQDYSEIKELAKESPPIMQSVGFLIYECETHVSIVDSIEKDVCGHLTKIPIAMILERVDLDG